MTKNLITRMNKKTRSTKSEKGRHARNSVEIASTNEQKDLKKLRIQLVVTKISTTKWKPREGQQ